MARLKNIPGAREALVISAFVVQEPEGNKGKWGQLFGNGNPIDLEIGVGKGQFLMSLAARHPERNVLGMEMYSSVLFRAMQKAEQTTTGAAEVLAASVSERPGLSEGCNFRLLRYDATELDSLFAPGEIAQIYLNFSDPWPKDRHADRRLTSARFLRRYERILAGGGGVTCKTDNAALFAFSLEQIRTCGWKLLYSTEDLHAAAPEQSDLETVQNALTLPTEYEEKFIRQGKQIYLFSALRP